QAGGEGRLAGTCPAASRARMRRFLSRKGRFSLRQSKSGTRSASKDFCKSYFSESSFLHDVPELLHLLEVKLKCHRELEGIDITPGPDGRFGFTIVGDSPLMVEDCMPNGPAGRSGLKAGDYVMEVNGIPVKHHETAAAMIKAAQGRPLRLGVLSMARRPKRLSSSMRVLSQSGDSVRESRAHKAMEFNKKVNVKYMFTS
uniref:PDZ domain-containing protein n=1 Tax=Seriola dumerili TaxID=41447 RepID=A0A3B4TZ93_SERDU